MTKRILIVEDHPTVQSITARLLQAKNYDVETAKNGVEALNFVTKIHLDMILLDIDMPKMDGIAFAKTIRTMDDPLKSKIPIIAITGNTRNYTSEDFTAVGINEYMLKPINFATLIEKLAHFFNTQK